MAEDYLSHRCQAFIDVKEIDVDYYFETDSANGKVVIAKGLDGIVYRLTLRDGIRGSSVKSCE